MTTKYAVHLTVDVTLVGRTTDDATSDMHFQMQVVDASYVDETAAALIAEHREQFAKLPSQGERDDAYLRSMSKPLYFVQKCNGEVVQIFHPRNENVAILNMKKSFLQTISLKMSVNKQDEHLEEHHGKWVVFFNRASRKQKKKEQKKNLQILLRFGRKLFFFKKKERIDFCSFFKKNIIYFCCGR